MAQRELARGRYSAETAGEDYIDADHDQDVKIVIVAYK
jgi:hypothetical protein